MEIQSYLKFIEDTLEAEEYFKSLGFGPFTRTKNESRVLRFWYTFQSLNEAGNRSLSFKFFPYDPDGNEQNSIDTTIVREPYNGIGDYLTLSIFLKAKYPNLLDKADIEIYGDSFEEKFRGYIKDFKNNFDNTEVKRLLKGDLWYTDYYPKW